MASIYDLKPSLIRGGECGKLPVDAVDATFFTGPVEPGKKPADSVQRAWDYAKTICKECPFIRECRESAVGELHGVWGGTDPYQRHLERRRRSRRVRNMTPERRAVLAAEMYRLHQGSSGLTGPTIARVRGLSTSVVQELLREHTAMLEEQRATARAAAAAAGTAIGGDSWVKAPSWPKASPNFGDAWVWYWNEPIAARYGGQTADGEFLRMKLGAGRTSFTKWFPVEAVDLRKDVTVEVLDWIGRKDAAKAA